MRAAKAWIRREWCACHASRLGSVLVRLALVGAGIVYLLGLAALLAMGSGPIGFVVGALILAWPVAAFAIGAIAIVAVLTAGDPTARR